MSIERQEIEKLATLSRIAIGEDTITEVSQRLSSVLELVDQLQAVNTDGVEAMSHPMKATQRLREDEVSEINQREAFQAIAPDTEEGLFLVPKVIE
ncbi:glutamyl-tRNA(Gln) amidotransferase, C subunit [marine gamma proteobacterium HTCC2207]|mgnify:FL=1|jgi:aspartyl-tRNA(Asn)/glutamyl-tRNA(Gln) amidotransferase subunit C|uniref:Aspartyl/glutamyl-tRNA(Asn/Gln) amidotransferase subunit C n=2 Tax=SAR92 clade TaxID=745004 RepID=Q1YU30_9GAMM|nr:glutamyl-tRNA(Gln) amidotransferase, C subunit [marine gamma proteobacterium HTCC2207] [gamma proteobacterium HTCC2207]ETN93254.1 Glutamyl-tRNA(Gln) amidotransferase subunit C [Gammaproteobacteria bacterium MOLA455]MBT5104712.1 Asp-tRNA(Asn)/Glu-tRNA(Gln) amidotransferase subunit GatC [Porticoccaceae bacterium]UVW35557.1 Asp-tRNA(Asn)/Glu-tRNA(Gln) amidotransferase subunit GatC [SAR92 clade bacterium H455]MBT6115885.1 Asp-tRNA(Asn)/Glu-tRNA(Gln) amidotransferase subunit GatC [Porticoccaceae |tara:strand:+ start:410 stop:697 length:288 start_codon:yes stop_codon:yes gene_type:complete